MKITIYYTEQTKEKLNEIRKQYHVSLSTIAQVLGDLMISNYSIYEKITPNILNKYLEDGKKNRTTIKPNNIKEKTVIMEKFNYNQAKISKFLSNLLFLYSNNDLETLFNETRKIKLEQYNKQIIEELKKKRDDWWNYNVILRNQTRAICQNKEYYKKKLAI